MDIETAKAVLNEARSHNVLDPDKELPLDETKLIRLATQLAELAHENYVAGERGDHTTSILRTAGYELKKQPTDEDEALYQDALEEAIENLPVPNPLHANEVPDFVADINNISDVELRRLHGGFSAASARINWLAAIQEAGQASAKIVADYHEDEWIAKADRKDHGGKAKANALLKIEAKAAVPKVKKWREIEKKHSIQAQKHKRQGEVYDNYVDRLSRQWTMRDNERGNHG